MNLFNWKHLQEIQDLPERTAILLVFTRFSHQKLFTLKDSCSIYNVPCMVKLTVVLRKRVQARTIIFNSNYHDFQYDWKLKPCLNLWLNSCLNSCLNSISSTSVVNHNLWFFSPIFHKFNCFPNNILQFCRSKLGASKMFNCIVHQTLLHLLNNSIKSKIWVKIPQISSGFNIISVNSKYK